MRDSVSPTIDVIVPTFNNVDQLRRCLASLLRQRRPGIRAIVCVDGSTDGTVDFRQETDPSLPVVVVEHPDRRNHGRASARNLALPHLQAEFVLLLDSDMELEPDAIEGHLALLRRRECVSVGAVEYSNWRDNLWARYQGTRGMNKSAPDSEIRPLDFVTANTALRSEDLIAAGGFDETLTGYGGEDTELAIRLHREHGRTFRFNAAARARTVETKTIAAGLEQLRQYGATNLRTTRVRHPDGPAPFMIDRARSATPADRLFRAAMNPLTDAVVDLLLPRTPWAIQRRLLNYKVVRAVFAGYLDGATP